MVTRLIYYCEKLDTEIEVRALNKEFDIEDHTPVKCVLTGEEIDDYYYDTLEEWLWHYIMEIYCKNKLILEKAVQYSKTLGIDNEPAIIYIKRLPPSFGQQGLIEHPRELDNDIYLNIWVKYDDERYVSLAHEMVHARQVLFKQPIDEHEAYLLEKTLDNDQQKSVL